MFGLKVSPPGFTELITLKSYFLFLFLSKSLMDLEYLKFLFLQSQSFSLNEQELFPEEIYVKHTRCAGYNRKLQTFSNYNNKNKNRIFNQIRLGFALHNVLGKVPDNHQSLLYFILKKFRTESKKDIIEILSPFLLLKIKLFIFIFILFLLICIYYDKQSL